MTCIQWPNAPWKVSYRYPPKHNCYWFETCRTLEEARHFAQWIMKYWHVYQIDIQNTETLEHWSVR